MKFLKKLVGFLVFLIILVLVLAIFAPSRMEVDKSVVIQGNAQEIYNQVIDLNNWSNWSPWIETIPNLETTIASSSSSGVGAVSEWTDGKQGGRQEIVEAAPPNHIKLKLNFSDFEGDNFVHWYFEPEGDKTNVRWTMEGAETGYPFKIFNWMFSSMVEKDYDRGLNNLKELIEK